MNGLNHSMIQIKVWCKKDGMNTIVHGTLTWEMNPKFYHLLNKKPQKLVLEQRNGITYNHVPPKLSFLNLIDFWPKFDLNQPLIVDVMMNEWNDLREVILKIKILTFSPLVLSLTFEGMWYEWNDENARLW